MANTTENTTRPLTMKDFFKEENGEIVPIDESVLIDFKDGDIVEGDVVRIDKDEVLVDIGYKSEGLIPSNELTIRKGADPHEVVELGPVIEVVKGGLILDIGLRGFLPASLVDIRRVRNLEAFLGQKLECKVIELNRSSNKVVLSRRAFLE